MPYFHIGFTVPAAIGAIAYQNKAKVYGVLFKAAAEALLTIGADRRHLDADIGFTAVLHTWGQRLDHHPHLHCIIPGGGISPDGKRWIPCKPVFFRTDRLSHRFRQLFLEYLMAAFKGGELQFFTDLIEFNDAAVFAAALAPLRTTEWVVYAKRPFINANAVLAYLAQYTHRVAITNSRLLSLDETHVSFRWKDYRQSGRQKSKVTRMDIAEFIRRFLLHVLPNGFHRIRQYGILANGHRAEKLARCRSLLLAPASTPDRNRNDASQSGISNHEACPCCGGRMRITESFDGRFSRPYHVRRLDGL